MARPRSAETRDANLREDIGGQPKGRFDFDLSLIPTGMEAQWIRESVMGQPDVESTQVAMEERGFTPALVSDHPQLAPKTLPGTENPHGLIRRGGQVLMLRPKKYADAEKENQAQETAEALGTVGREVADKMDGRNFRNDEKFGAKAQFRSASPKFRDE